LFINFFAIGEIPFKLILFSDGKLKVGIIAIFLIFDVSS